LGHFRPRNRGSIFAFDALLDDRVKLDHPHGKAGSGKTCSPWPQGLKRTVLDREFRRLVGARPPFHGSRNWAFCPARWSEKACAMDAAHS
jgi:predicted ribonuclease YlaK